jgi:tetratricopeptide (TPR) repeat protein
LRPALEEPQAAHLTPVKVVIARRHAQPFTTHPRLGAKCSRPRRAAPPLPPGGLTLSSLDTGTGTTERILNMRNFLALLLGLMSFGAPSGSPAPAAPASPAKPTDIKEFINDQYQDNPDQRYNNIGRGTNATAAWKKGEYAINGNWLLARQVSVGAVADLSAKLDFAPLTADGQKAESQLSFVVLPGQVALAALVRERTAGKVVGKIRLFHGRTNDVVLLREMTFPGDLTNGMWTLHFSYGLLRVEHEGHPVAWGHFESGINPVVGIAWGQQDGGATWRQLRLRGGRFPPDRPAEALLELQTAARLNAEGLDFYRKKKLPEALQQTRKALELYHKILGEDTYDTANALDNVGTLYHEQRQYNEARPYFDRALKVRQKLLGEEHPNTALIYFHIGRSLYEQGKRQDARPYLEKAAAIFAKVEGADSRLGRLMEVFPDLNQKAK